MLLIVRNFSNIRTSDNKSKHSYPSGTIFEYFNKKFKIQNKVKNLAQVRSSIIKAAEKHFTLSGLEKTTLDDISAENGKCKSSLYYHFKNKHDIFKAVIESEFEDVKKELLLVLASPADSQEKMRAYLRTRLDAMSKMGAFGKFSASRFALGDNLAAKLVNTARKAYDEWEKAFFIKNMQDGINSGSIPAEMGAELFSETLINILKALELQFFQAEDKAKIRSTYEGMIEMMIR